jgi:hypothetical protein
MRKPLSLLFACTLALLCIATAAAAPLAMQSSTVSGVTLNATPMALSGERWEFEIVLETHSGDLGDDLAKRTTLVADNGAASSPVDWRGDPPGGHHRKGVLAFNAVTPPPARLELKIIRAEEPAPRVFRWQLTMPSKGEKP